MGLLVHLHAYYTAAVVLLRKSCFCWSCENKAWFSWTRRSAFLLSLVFSSIMLWFSIYSFKFFISISTFAPPVSASFAAGPAGFLFQFLLIRRRTRKLCCFDGLRRRKEEYRGLDGDNSEFKHIVSFTIQLLPL